MKKSLVFLTALVALGAAAAASGQVEYVPGYLRADGTYVQGYVRVEPPRYYVPVVRPRPFAVPATPTPAFMQGQITAQQMRLQQLRIQEEQMRLQREHQAQQQAQDQDDCCSR